jgi:hypothetical protein
MRFEPHGAGRDVWIKPGFPPPSSFVATAMHLAMMASAQWDGELIADFAPHCPALRKAQMVGVRGLTVANQTGLLGHISDVVAVSNPTRLGQSQRALIDQLRSRPCIWLPG